MSLPSDPSTSLGTPPLSDRPCGCLRQLLPDGGQLHAHHQGQRARLERRPVRPVAGHQLPAVRVAVAGAHRGRVRHVSDEGGQLCVGGLQQRHDLKPRDGASQYLL